MSVVLSIMNSEAAGGWCGGLRERENRWIKYSERWILFTKSSCNNNVNPSNLSDEIHFPNPTKYDSKKWWRYRGGKFQRRIILGVQTAGYRPLGPGCHEEDGHCGTGSLHSALLKAPDQPLRHLRSWGLQNWNQILCGYQLGVENAGAAAPGIISCSGGTAHSKESNKSVISWR